MTERTACELAQELHDLKEKVAELSQDVLYMDNTQTLGEEIFNGLPFFPAGAQKYFARCEAIRKRRTDRYLARSKVQDAQDSHITHFTPPCESLTGA